MAAIRGGRNVARCLVRALPWQAVAEAQNVAIGAAGGGADVVRSIGFEITSMVTDRNRFDPTVNPDAAALSAVGFVVDVFAYCTRAFRIIPEFGINTSANWRAAAFTAFALGFGSITTRVFGSYVRIAFQNTAALGGVLDYGVYVRG